MQYVLEYAVDLLYMILAVVTVAIFTKRGFIESVFRFGRSITAGVICYFAGPHVSKLIYDKLIYRGIVDFVSEKVEQFLINAVGSVDVQSLIDGLPFFVKQLVDRESMEAKYGNAVGNFEAVAHDFAETVSQPLASLLSNLIAYVLVFLASMLLLFILFKVLDGIFKLPILNAINKTLGFIFGVLATCLLLAAITFLLGVLVGILGSTSTLKQLIEMSHLFRFFNNLSIFDLF